MNILIYISAFLGITGIVFDYLYCARRKKRFDGRCNDYFVISRACWITCITLAITHGIIKIFCL